jgi:hypothetical protein
MNRQFDQAANGVRREMGTRSASPWRCLALLALTTLLCAAAAPTLAQTQTSMMGCCAMGPAVAPGGGASFIADTVTQAPGSGGGITFNVTGTGGTAAVNDTIYAWFENASGAPAPTLSASGPMTLLHSGSDGSGNSWYLYTLKLAISDIASPTMGLSASLVSTEPVYVAIAHNVSTSSYIDFNGRRADRTISRPSRRRPRAFSISATITEALAQLVFRPALGPFSKTACPSQRLAATA